MSLEARRRAGGRGRLGETRAAWLLRLKGYRILARDLRTPVGELDLVAKRGRTLAFVEVKTRPGIDEALEALRPAQCRRIERAAEAFLKTRPDLAGCDIRFDLIAVGAAWRPRHVAGAWRPAA